MNGTVRVIAFAVLAAVVLFALAPLVLGAEEIPTARHHFLHAVMLAAAAFAGILLAGRSRRAGNAGWLVIAMVSPVIAMLLMWPSEYAYFETHRYGHVLEHLALIGCGFLTGYGGQRYADGIGWAAGLSVVAMALIGIWGYGVGPASATAPVSQTVQPPVFAVPDVARGATVFKQNCAVCHGVDGRGAEAPSLRNESSRKRLAAAEAWILHPAPPMPALYPDRLSAQDVADVAGYIETLR